MNPANVIIGSVLSEKGVRLAEGRVYTLRVAEVATKCDIRAALKAVFDVDAIDVNTCITRGAVTRRPRAKNAGPVTVKKPNVKKAYVRLKEGQTLPFSGVVEAGNQ